MTPAEALLAQSLEVLGPDELWRGDPRLYASRSGEALALVGRHWGWGWCWCQPEAVSVEWGLSGRPRWVTVHRALADAPPSLWDERGMGGWEVSAAGSVYPSLSPPASSYDPARSD